MKILSIVFILSVLFVMAGHVFAENKQCENAVMYVEEGGKLIQSEPARAEALFREALRLCPESANASYNIGLSLYSQGKNTEAVDALKVMLNENPDHADAMRMLAYILIKENIDPARGKMIAENILKANPKDEGAKKLVMLALTESLPTTPAAPSDKKALSKQVASIPAAVSDVDTAIPVTKIKNPNAIAVVIGNRDYNDKDIPSVDYALNDAEAVKKYLVNVLGYQEGNIIYEQNASKAKFDAIFGTKENYEGRLYNYLKKGHSDIFVFYSGHGAPDPKTKQGYFVPADADSHAINLTAYPLKQLYDNIAKIAKDMNTPNVFIVVDSCFSGATEKGLLLKNVSPIGIEVQNQLFTMPNAVTMTSSSGSEVSSWYPEKGHSMFTYFFLRSLKENAESKLTAGEVFKKITDEAEGLPYYARRLHGRVQTPQIMGDANRVMIRR